MTTGNDRLDEALRLLDDLREPHGREPTAGDALRAVELLAGAMAELPEWVWERSNRCCPPGESCCNCD